MNHSHFHFGARLAAIACLLPGATAGIRAQAQEAASKELASRQEGAVIAHLNSTLTWYRQVQGSGAWVMQPSDEIYKTSQQDLANEVVVNSFASARAMVPVIGGEGSPGGAKPGNERSSQLATLEATNTERLLSLKEQQADLDAKISAAAPADQPALTARREVVQAEIGFDSALESSLQKAAVLSASPGAGGNAGTFAAQVEALQQAGPAALLEPSGAAQAKVPPAKSAPAASSDGLVNRAATLFSLMRHLREMDVLAKKSDELKAEANSLADPLVADLRATVVAGNDAGKSAEPMTDPDQINKVRDRIQALTARFNNLSGALVPLRREARALEQTRNNLSEWKRSMDIQAKVIMRVFLARAVALVIALAVLIGVSEVWRRATFRYVHDVRRRRQFLLIRRFATAILMVTIIVMGFVSNFSSFATFAGLITAGIAVALQTVVLSVAAYFFLIGRYGVRVGDRVTVSGVTGDVIDIGLVRVFLLELAGTGIDLHPTGRVVVLANSALFSTTPLYKQLPGTDYAWHEVFVSMAADADPARAQEVLLNAVNKVYGGYRSSIERQHGNLERILDYKTDLPAPSAHIRLTDSGLEVVVRFPAEIRRMSEIDEQVTRQVIAAFRAEGELKKTLASMPRIRAAVKS